MDPVDDLRTEWLARELFKAFAGDCPGLMLYSLACGCIFYRRVLSDGSLGASLGVFRDPGDGPCRVCMQSPGAWQDRVVEETPVYRMCVRVD